MSPDILNTDQSLPSEVYHYTNWIGLQGILKDQSLWATHYSYLNDIEEIVHFKKALKEYVIYHVFRLLEQLSVEMNGAKEIIEQNCGINRLGNDETDRCISILYDALLGCVRGGVFCDPFITSFCSASDTYVMQNGLLSQWRAYGNDGGYAIEFKTDMLKNLVEEENRRLWYEPISMIEMIYSDNEDKLYANFRSELETVKKHILELIEFTARGDWNNWNESTQLKRKRYDAFAKCIAGYKHKAFKEEQEIRIFGFRPSDKTWERAKQESHEVKPLAFVKQGNQFQYIDLFSWGKNENPKFQLPINRIIVGPQPNKETKAKQLEEQLSGTDIKIIISDIPYSPRQWRGK